MREEATACGAGEGAAAPWRVAPPLLPAGGGSAVPVRGGVLQRLQRLVQRRQAGGMGDADEHHLGRAHRTVRGLDLLDALQEHLPGARQRPHRQFVGERGAARALVLRQGRVVGRRRHEAQAGHQMVELGEIGEHRRRIGAGVVLAAELGKRGGDVALHQRLEQVDDARPVGKAKHVAHVLRRHSAGGVRDSLVEDRLGVAHRALGGARDHGQRLVLGLDPLELADARQVGLDQRGVDAPQIEALAARQDGDGDLADLGGREDELHVRRRFLQRLQQAVEGLVRQHVDLVDDVDLVAGRHRRVAHLLDDVANVVDAGVGGGVHLDDVDMPAFHDGAAVLAFLPEVDGRLVDVGSLVVERARQNAGGRRLADAAHAGQHPGLGDAAGGERVGKRAHHRLLADEGGKILRPVFAREHAVWTALCRRLLSGLAHLPVALQNATRTIGRPGSVAPGRARRQCHKLVARAALPAVEGRRREVGTVTRAGAR